MGEGVQRAPIVGVHDFPGLEVSDDLFDDVTDLVDLLIKFFFPVHQVTVDGFFDRGEYVISHVA